MHSIPPAAEPLLPELAAAFTRLTYPRFVVLLCDAIEQVVKRKLHVLGCAGKAQACLKASQA